MRTVKDADPGFRHSHCVCVGVSVWLAKVCAHTGVFVCMDAHTQKTNLLNTIILIISGLPVRVWVQRLTVDLERSASVSAALGARVAQCTLNGLADFLYR